MLNPTRIGDISEAMCLTKFLQKGWDVAVPFGHGHAYDLIVDRKLGNGLERVQVKTARWNEKGFWVVPLTRSVDKSRSEKDRYEGQVELIAAYCQKHGKVFLFPFSACSAKFALQIRACDPLNNQKSGINYASDFELV